MVRSIVGFIIPFQLSQKKKNFFSFLLWIIIDLKNFIKLFTLLIFITVNALEFILRIKCKDPLSNHRTRLHKPKPFNQAMDRMFNLEVSLEAPE